MPSYTENDTDDRRSAENQRRQAECKLAYGFVFGGQRISSTMPRVHDVNMISLDPEWNPEANCCDDE